MDGRNHVTCESPEVGRANAPGSEVWAADGRGGESQGRKLEDQLHAGRGGEVEVK